ncbi:MAG: c-type cytochrome domain-containing protein, partial [Actinomycetota bacterium]
MDKRSRAKGIGLVWRSAVAATTLLTLTVLWAPGGPDAAARAASSAADPSAIELFEKEIRPLLVSKCQACHDDRKSQGGLRLTSRARLLTGGGSGRAIVPGKPEQSLLIKAVERRGELKMPPAGKLTDGQVNSLRRWVALGAPWPETKAARTDSAAAVHRRWWAFKAPRTANPPAGSAASPIDRFVRA